SDRLQARGEPRRQAGRVGAAWKGGEEVRIEVAEVVKRLGPRTPRVPAVELDQALEATLAKDGLQRDHEQSEESCAPDRHEHCRLGCTGGRLLCASPSSEQPGCGEDKRSG